MIACCVAPPRRLRDDRAVTFAAHKQCAEVAATIQPACSNAQRDGIGGALICL
jgi:hypothetical protein